jgi:hypothetical protein
VLFGEYRRVSRYSLNGYYRWLNTHTEGCGWVLFGEYRRVSRYSLNGYYRWLNTNTEGCGWVLFGEYRRVSRSVPKSINDSESTLLTLNGD